MPVESLSEFPARATALAIEPPPARSVDPNAVLQRLRYHPGRSLTAADLRLEADNAEIRFGLMVRALADGVIDGFQVALADQDEASGEFDVSPGYAISPRGQDLTLNRRIRLQLADLPRVEATQPNVVPPLSGIGVLVLEPISGEETRFSAAADKDAAFRRDQQLDPDAAPYQDARIVDGARISWVRLDTLTVTPTDPQAADIAGAALAVAESTGGEMAAFTQRSVALAMVGVEAGGRLLWVHRHAAARPGGGVPRVLALPRQGLRMPPRLRQARVDALLETFTAAAKSGVAGAVDAALPGDLPAAGVLPKHDDPFWNPFPDDWRVDFSPIPMGQLDALLADCEALAGYDLSRSEDEIRIYHPVPDALFDPELLIQPGVGQAFIDAGDHFRQSLSDRLAHRAALLTHADTVEGRLDTDIANETLAAYDPDPQAISGENSLPAPAPPDPESYDSDVTALFDAWRGTVPDFLLTDAQRDLIDFASSATADPRGLRHLATSLQAGVDAADDFVDFGFTKVQAEIYRLRQVILDNEEATKLATFPVLASLAKGSNALANSKGLMDHFVSIKSSVDTPPPPPPSSVSAGFDLATMLPVATFDTPFVFAGFDDASQLAGTTALTGSLATLVDFNVSGDFGLTLADEPDRGFSEIQGFTEPLVLEPKLTQTESAYLDLFKTSRDVAYDEIALADANEKRAGITFASAIPGDYQDLRTVTIADRLATSTAQAARTAALRAKSDTLAGTNALGISMTGLRAPIMSIDAEQLLLTRADFEASVAPIDRGNTADAVAALRTAIVDVDSEADVIRIPLHALDLGNPAELRIANALRGLHSPIAAEGLSEIVLRRWLDPNPTGTDEGAYLTSAVEILESVVAVFRATEQRIAEIRGLLKSTTVLLEQIEQIAGQWREALAASDTSVAEGRHDLEAFRALLEEEQARVDRLAERRAATLRDHVRFSVFARPRHLRPHADGLTSSRLLPGVYDDPLPAALARPVRLPAELMQMMDILRDMPIGWFAAEGMLLEEHRKPTNLNAMFHWAANASATKLNVKKTMMIASELGTKAPARAERGGKAARARKAAGQIATIYQDIASRFLVARMAIDLGEIDGLDLNGKRRRAAEELSLNDLIEGTRNKASAKQALQELTDIEAVVGALFLLLKRAAPAIRLLWADKLSAFDGEVLLSDVTDIPGWSALSVEERHDIRRLHGWLFGRMKPGVAEARALMSDIVRVALLLAANADTDEIVKARLPVEKTVGGGDTVELTIDLGEPAVGMPVWFDLVGSNRIRGLVSNVVKDRVHVEIDPLVTAKVTLLPETPIFLDAKRLGLQGYGR